MADNTKESVSALVDGEASEIEVHRVLRNLQKDEKLKSSFITYQQIRVAIRRNGILSGQDHLALHKRIGEAVSGESILDESGSTTLTGFRAGIRTYSGVAGLIPSAYVKPAAGLAIAASLVVAIFTGIQIQTGQDRTISESEISEVGNLTEPVVPLYVVSGTGTEGNTRRSAEGENDVSIMAGQAGVVGQNSDQRLGTDTGSGIMGDELVELDEEKQKLVREYLLRHDRMTRFNPNVKVVTFKNPDKNH